jgi:hypothetical protein
MIQTMTSYGILRRFPGGMPGENVFCGFSSGLRVDET